MLDKINLTLDWAKKKDWENIYPNHFDE